ncbi:hypothetical protein T09_6748 [Trichinella sp. T9]|nr:hypothetical protein T09_6748 [Trichinella sp. T9]
MDRFVDRRFDGGASHFTKQTFLVMTPFAVESFETFQQLETNVSGAGQRFEIFHFKKRLASHRRTHIPDVDIDCQYQHPQQERQCWRRTRFKCITSHLGLACASTRSVRCSGSRPARGRTASTLAAAWALHSARVAAARLVEARSSSSVVAGAGSISTSTDMGLAGGARQMASSGRRMATIGAGGATIGAGGATIGPGEATIGAGGATIGPGEATIGACFSNASVDVAQFIGSLVIVGAGSPAVRS